MEAIARQFAKLKKLPGHAKVVLECEGERLAPDSTVEDAELEDEDMLMASVHA